MHCPLCGGELELVPRKPFDYIDDWWDLPEPEQSEYLKRAEDYEYIQRECYKCLGRGCFQPDYPLYFHGVFGGIYSAPGDSWSLSWVK